MQFRVPFVSCALILAVVACGKPDPVADNAPAANVPATANVSEPEPLGGPPENETKPATTPAAATTKASIPTALQGRWGLTPGDCTSTRGDAKGLMVVSPEMIRFYESRAIPAPGVTADSNSVTGNFAFTGEGQSWTKFETLERHNDRLVRTESNPAASYTYAKC